MQGKVNIVTGGGTGIGFGVAAGLAELGSKVVIASRSKDKIEEAAERLGEFCASGGEIAAIECNIRDREQVAQMVSQTIDKFGRLDGLVNNGGGQFWAPAENITPNGFHAVVDTNLKGTWNCIQEAYHQYMGENGGQIVNIVLISSMGMAGQSHSAAAREAVKNLSMTLGAEWAAKNIQVNCVAPGIIYSDTAVAAYGEQGAQMFLKAAKNIGKGRMGEVFEENAGKVISNDLVPQIIFNLSPAAQYTTGQTVDVCGGLSLYNNYLKGMVEIEEWMAERGINMG